MYDEELALTGLGTMTLGGVVFDSWWLMVLGLLLVASGLVVTRWASKNRGAAASAVVSDENGTLAP